MKEIIWVFGNSASGKETFIRNIAGGKADYLLGELGWANKKISICHPSIDNIGQLEGDPITKDRHEILTDCREQLKTADIVLIKWQIVDSDSGRMEQLKSEIPNARHEIIQLVVSDAILEKRLSQKSWWGDNDVKGFVREENEIVEHTLMSMQDGFNITKIKWSPDKGYSILAP